MIVQCPHCGGMVTVNGLGRKAFNMPVIKVCDALRLHHSIPAAAESLGCSRGLIYKILKANGMTPMDVTKSKMPKVNYYYGKKSEKIRASSSK